MGESVVVSAQGGERAYTFRLIDEGRLLHMDEVIHHSRPLRDPDVYATCWCFGFAHLGPGQAAVRARDGLVPLQGRVGVLIPPFSVVEWNLASTEIRFEAIFSLAPLPPGSPTSPVYFDAEEMRLPRSERELLRALPKLARCSGMGREAAASALARKTKKRIDASYKSATMLRTIARELRSHPAVMAKQFKAGFGLSPVQYRNRLRVVDSLSLLLMKGYSVGSAGHEVGFSHISRYARNFQKWFQVPPSHFMP